MAPHHELLRLALASVFPFVVFSDELRRVHESLLRDAIRLSGQTMDHAAAEAELNPAQFARQIAMVEGSHKRLAMQPRGFWQWYAVALASYFGLPRETRVARRLARVRVARKTMARATLSRKAKTA